MEFKKFRVVFKDFTYCTIEAENLKKAQELAVKTYGSDNIYSVYWWVDYETN